jgi:hypothetical protein
MMPSNKANRVLFAYFERPVKEYARTLESVRPSGGLNKEEVQAIRAQAPAVHAKTILRHLGETPPLDMASTANSHS